MNKYNRGISLLEILLSLIILSFILSFLFMLLSQVKDEANNNSIQTSFLYKQAEFVSAIEDDILNFGIDYITTCSLDDFQDNTYLPKDDYDYNNESKCILIKFNNSSCKDGTSSTSSSCGYKFGVISIFEYYDKTLDDGNVDKSSRHWVIKYEKGAGYDDNGTLCDPQNSSCQWTGKDTYHRDTRAYSVIMDEIPEGVNLSTSNNLVTTVKYFPTFSNKTNYSSGNLYIPIETLSGERYDLDISFIYKFQSKDKSKFCKYSVDETSKTIIDNSKDNDNFICQGGSEGFYKGLKCEYIGAITKLSKYNDYFTGESLDGVSAYNYIKNELGIDFLSYKLC